MLIFQQFRDCSQWHLCKHLKLPHTELAACKIRDVGSGNTNFWLWNLFFLLWNFCSRSNLYFSTLLCSSFTFSTSWDRHAYWGTKLLLFKSLLDSPVWFSGWDGKLLSSLFVPVSASWKKVSKSTGWYVKSVHCPGWCEKRCLFSQCCELSFLSHKFSKTHLRESFLS